MKLFSTLFALFFLFLSTISCDGAMAEDTCGTEVHLHNAADQDHDHSEADLCSPFCSCQCCHSNIIPSEMFLNTASIAETELQYSYMGILPSATTFNFWHPPKA